MKKKRVFRVRNPNRPALTFKEDDYIPEEYKGDFDRLEAELAAFNEFVENDQEIKETFDRLEKELERMELIIK